MTQNTAAPMAKAINEINRVVMQTEEDEPSPYATPESISSSPISASNLARLQTALIAYVTKSKRIFQAVESRIWEQFYNQNPELSELEEHFGPAQLSEQFVNCVLPSVFNLTLTSVEKSILDMLRLHPDFERRENGYILLPINERPLSFLQPKAGKDYRVVAHKTVEKIFAPKVTSEELELNSMPLETDHHTLVMQSFENLLPPPAAELSLATAALISAALSNDLELTTNVLLEPNELHARLLVAKKDFEQHGNLANHFHQAKDLQQKISRTAGLRRAVSNLFATKFTT